VSFCKVCGTENESTNKFCKKCGEVIKKSSKKSVESGLREEVRRLEEEIRILKEEHRALEEKKALEEKQDKRKTKKEKIILEESLEKIKDEIKEELSLEFKDDIKEEIREEVSGEIKGIKNDVSKNVKVELQKEISKDIKENALADIKDEVSDEIKREVRAEVRSELNETIDLRDITRAINQENKKTSSSFLLFLMIVAVAVAYFYFAHMYGPKNTVKEYMDALMANNYDVIYNYIDTGEDSTFVNKDKHTELLKNNESINGYLNDYEIEDVIYSKDNKTAMVKVKAIYFKEKVKYENNLTIELSRDKERKYYIFNTWSIKDNSGIGIDVIDNYTIIVPEDSKVYFDGIELGSKYMEVDNNELVDTYSLPKVFSKNTELKVILLNGTEIIKNVVPSFFYDKYYVSIDDDDLGDDKVLISDTIVEYLMFIMNSAFKGNDFAKLNSIISDTEDVVEFNNLYNNFLDNLDLEESKFSNFDITNLVVQNIDFNHSYYYVVDIRIDYTWKCSLNNIFTNKSDFGFYTVTLKYEGGEYKLIKIDTLPNVFVN